MFPERIVYQRLGSFPRYGSCEQRPLSIIERGPPLLVRLLDRRVIDTPKTLVLRERDDLQILVLGDRHQHRAGLPFLVMTIEPSRGRSMTMRFKRAFTALMLSILIAGRPS